MRKPGERSEGGTALVVCLMILAILTLLGTTAILNTSMETKITHNARTSEEAFYAAEGGIEHVLCLPAPGDLEEGQVIISEALSNAEAFGPKYDVAVLAVVPGLWEIQILYIESIGYDRNQQSRRVLRADIQIAPSAAEGPVKPLGVYPHQYDGKDSLS